MKVFEASSSSDGLENRMHAPSLSALPGGEGNSGNGPMLHLCFCHPKLVGRISLTSRSTPVTLIVSYNPGADPSTSSVRRNPQPLKRLLDDRQRLGDFRPRSRSAAGGRAPFLFAAGNENQPGFREPRDSDRRGLFLLHLEADQPAVPAYGLHPARLPASFFNPVKELLAARANVLRQLLLFHHVEHLQCDRAGQR